MLIEICHFLGWMIFMGALSFAVLMLLYMIWFRIFRCQSPGWVKRPLQVGQHTSLGAERINDGLLVVEIGKLSGNPLFVAIPPGDPEKSTVLEEANNIDQALELANKKCSLEGEG